MKYDLLLFCFLSFAQSFASRTQAPSLSEIDRIEFTYVGSLAALDCKLSELEYRFEFAPNQQAVFMQKIKKALEYKRAEIDLARLHTDSLYLIYGQLERALQWNRFYIPAIEAKLQIMDFEKGMNSSYWRYLQKLAEEQKHCPKIKGIAQNACKEFILDLQYLKADKLFLDMVQKVDTFFLYFPLVKKICKAESDLISNILKEANMGMVRAYEFIAQEAAEKKQFQLAEQYHKMAGDYFTNHCIAKQKKDTILQPLRISPYFSGNFAELRNDHFHGGVDYRSLQREGIPIYSIQDAYIYRIGISPLGYGKVLYLKHSDKISIYAHLSAFEASLDNAIKGLQYADKKNEGDWILPKPIFISAGELIAYSGNTGSSGGPHLHFEIRDTSDQFQLNPCLFLPCPTDTLCPLLKTFALYTKDQKAIYREILPISRVLKSGDKAGAIPEKIRKNISRIQLWTLSDTQAISVYSHTKFGIEAIDKMNDTPFSFGLYKLSFWINDSCVSSHCFDSVQIEFTDQINQHIDYAYFIENRKRIEKSNLDFFFNGKFNSPTLWIVCEDISGNASILKVSLNDKAHLIKSKKEKSSKKAIISPWSEFNYTSKNILIHLPTESVFDSTAWKKTSRCKKSDFLACYQIPMESVPLRKPMKIQLPLPKKIPDSLLNKLLIIRVDKNGKQIPLPSSIKGEKIHGISQKFGIFAIGIDTLAPTLSNVNLERENAESKYWEAKIIDNMSGLSHYEAFLNGTWWRLYYDRKNNHLRSDAWQHLAPGTYELRILLEDEVKNKVQHTYTIKR